MNIQCYPNGPFLYYVNQFGLGPDWIVLMLSLIRYFGYFMWMKLQATDNKDYVIKISWWKYVWKIWNRTYNGFSYACKFSISINFLIDCFDKLVMTIFLYISFFLICDSPKYMIVVCYKLKIFKILPSNMQKVKIPLQKNLQSIKSLSLKYSVFFIFCSKHLNVGGKNPIKSSKRARFTLWSIQKRKVNFYFC